MRVDWDTQKALANLEKHGVSFQEASEVFDDPLHLSVLDHRFEYFEERWITVGMSHGRRLLVVANLFFNDQMEEVIRIITAREASRNEQKQYENV
jgi:hypothetical protein